MTAIALYAVGTDGFLYSPFNRGCFAGEAGGGCFAGGEVNIAPELFDIPQTENGSYAENEVDSEDRADNTNKSDNGSKTDIPAWRPGAGENPNALNEELKKPLKALIDFLKTDDIKYFYRTIPYDCIEFLKTKYAAAIILSGGEAKAIKGVIRAKFGDYENHIGRPAYISGNITEITKLTETDFPEMESSLRVVGSNAVIEEAFRLKTEFDFIGEEGSIKFVRDLRIIKTNGGWFIYPKDLL